MAIVQVLLLLSDPARDHAERGGGQGAALAVCLNQMKKSGLLLLAHVVPTDTAHAGWGLQDLGGVSFLGDAAGAGQRGRPPSPPPAPAFSPLRSDGGHGGAASWAAAARMCQRRQRELAEVSCPLAGWLAGWLFGSHACMPCSASTHSCAVSSLVSGCSWSVAAPACCACSD
jgi:hypothetical protein